MSPYDTYNAVLDLATDVGHAEQKFWRATVSAFDAGDLDIDAVRRLIGHSSINGPIAPSRATAYRRLDQWREIVAALNNPGRGA